MVRRGRGGALGLFGRRQRGKDFALQRWEVAVNRLPHNLKINAKVPVRQGISHVMGGADRQLRMKGGKVGEFLVVIVASLSNDFKVSDHRVLIASALAEANVSRAACISLDSIDGFKNVI